MALRLREAEDLLEPTPPAAGAVGQVASAAASPRRRSKAAGAAAAATAAAQEPLGPEVLLPTLASMTAPATLWELHAAATATAAGAGEQQGSQRPGQAEGEEEGAVLPPAKRPRRQRRQPPTGAVQLVPHAVVPQLTTTGHNIGQYSFDRFPDPVPAFRRAVEACGLAPGSAPGAAEAAAASPRQGAQQTQQASPRQQRQQRGQRGANADKAAAPPARLFPPPSWQHAAARLPEAAAGDNGSSSSSAEAPLRWEAGTQLPALNSLELQLDFAGRPLRAAATAAAGEAVAEPDPPSGGSAHGAGPSSLVPLAGDGSRARCGDGGCTLCHAVCTCGSLPLPLHRFWGGLGG